MTPKPMTRRYSVTAMEHDNRAVRKSLSRIVFLGLLAFAAAQTIVIGRLSRQLAEVGAGCQR